MRLVILLAWSLAGLASASRPRAEEPAEEPAPSTPVMRLSNTEIGRLEYETWLLRERGEVLAPSFARSFLLQKEAERLGVVPEPGAAARAVEASIRTRLESAFRGRKEAWLEELAMAGRSELGVLAERRIEAEARLLAEEIARLREKSIEEIEATLFGAAQIMVLPAMAAPSDPLSPSPTETVLELAGHPIQRAPYARWLRRYRGEIEARRFAEMRVLELASEEAGIEVRPEEIDQRVLADTEEFVETFYGGDWDMWRRKLRKEGRTQEEHLRQARQSTRTTMLLEGIVVDRRSVTPEQVRAAWIEAYGETGQLLELRWIRIDAQTPPRGEETTDAQYEQLWERSRAHALRRTGNLRQRALAGQDFATLAERYSDDSASRSSGGKPAEQIKPEDLLPELVGPVLELTRGSVSEPIAVGNSFYLIELLDRRVIELDSVREALRRELMTRPASRAEVAALRLELVRGLSLEILPAMFD